MKSVKKTLLGLAVGDVHVWRVDLEAPTPGPAVKTLDPAEKARAARFVFERDRRRFVASHGALRAILSLYVGEAPEDVAFTEGPHGKPALLQGKGAVRFNLSHSGEIALVAVGRDREVGVDVEAWREIADLLALARTCFSEAERAVLASLPELDRRPAFFAGWTRKEAFLKALGDGLARPLDRFDVTIAPRETPRLLRVEGDDPARFAMRALDVPVGYTAAVVTEGPIHRVRRFDWEASASDAASTEIKERSTQPRATAPSSRRTRSRSRARG